MKRISILALLLALVLLLSGCSISDDWRNAESIFTTGEAPWVFHMKNGRAGLVDGEGNVIAMLPKEWAPSGTFIEGLLIVQNTETNLYGYINARGELVIPFKFPFATAFSEGLAAVKTTTYPTLWGYIDTTGELVIRDDYDHANAFSQGYAVVTVGSKEFYIDRSGKNVFGSTFEDAAPFRNGYAQIKRRTGTTVEYINLSGETQFTFTEKGSVHYASYVGGRNTLRVYESGSAQGLCGYIRLNGKELTRRRWLNHLSGDVSANGYAIVKDPQTQLYGLAQEPSFSIVVPLEYATLRGHRISEVDYSAASTETADGASQTQVNPPDLYYAEKDGKVGVIDMTGRVVVPIEYDDVTRVADGRLFAQKGGKWMILDEQGNVLVK